MTAGFDGQDIENFLRAGGQIRWAEWLEMPAGCRAAFKAAGEKISRERLTALVTAILWPDEARAAFVVLTGEESDTIEPLMGDFADVLASEARN